MDNHLFPFQDIGVRFLRSRGRAALFDEMGLGKSVQALQALAQSQDDRPGLIVCPKVLIPEWIAHIRTWLPEWQPYLLAKTNEEGFRLLKSSAGRNSIGIINYASLGKLPPPYDLPQWSVVIIDEAHYVKTPAALRSQRVRRLSAKADRVFLLTGTPPPRPDQMWHLLHLVAPGRFPSYWKFFNTHVTYWTLPEGGKVPTGIRDIQAYTEDIGPFCLRRTKAQVMPDLPPVFISRLPAQLSDSEQAVYDIVLRDELKSEEGRPLLFPNILVKLNMLRKLATSPWIADEAPLPLGLDCPKVDVLVEKALSLTTPFVVFTHFRKTKRLARQTLENRGIKTADVDTLHVWRSGDAQALVDTTYKGGVGLNLPEASDAFFVEPPAGYTHNEQAIGRLQRPGGKHSSYHIWQLYSTNTVDVHFYDHLDRMKGKAGEMELALEVWRTLKGAH